MVFSAIEGSILLQGTVSGTDATAATLYEPTHALRIYLENPGSPTIQNNIFLSGGGNALVGSDGITVTSGSNITTIAGFRGEFVSASGSLQNQINSINVDEIEPAIIGADGITVTSGINTTTVAGFRTEFVSASGSLQSQIDNLDSIYATDSNLTSVSGHLQSQIDVVEASDVDSITASGSVLTGGIVLTGLGSVSLYPSGQIIAISGGEGSGVTDHGTLTGLLDDDHPQYLRTDGTRTLTGNWSAGNQNISSINALTAVTGTFTTGITVGNGTTYLYPHIVRTGDVGASGTVSALRGEFSNGLTVSGVPVSVTAGGGVSSITPGTNISIVGTTAPTIGTTDSVFFTSVTGTTGKIDLLTATGILLTHSDSVISSDGDLTLGATNNGSGRFAWLHADGPTGVTYVTADGASGGIEITANGSSGQVNVRANGTFGLILNDAAQFYNIAIAGITVFSAQSTGVTLSLPIRGSSSDTVTAPTYSWGGDTDTGMSRVGANIVGISAGGTFRLTISGANATTSGIGVAGNVTATRGDFGAQITASGLFATTDGAVTVPAIAFDGDRDTGMYRISANRLGFTAGGNQAIDCNGTTVNFPGFIRAADGSATSPTHGFTNDGDVGMFRVGTNVLGFSAGGTTRVTVSGNDALTSGINVAGHLTAIRGDFATGLTVSGIPVNLVAGGAATDHGTLSGLTDDDHPQYLLTDGTRTLTGSWSAGNQNITNVGTITATTVSGGNVQVGGTVSAQSGSFSTTLTVSGTPVMNQGVNALVTSGTINRNTITLQARDGVYLHNTAAGPVISGTNAPSYSWQAQGGNSAVTNTEAIITGLIGISLPKFQLNKEYELYLNIGFDEPSANVQLTIRMYAGTNGTIGETVLESWTVDAQGPGHLGVPAYRFTATAGPKIGFTSDYSANATGNVLSDVSQCKVVEVLLST